MTMRSRFEHTQGLSAYLGGGGGGAAGGVPSAWGYLSREPSAELKQRQLGWKPSAHQLALRVVSGEAQPCPPGALGLGEPEANNRPGGQVLCWGQLMLWRPGEHEAPFLLTSVGEGR